jgi:xylulokinase
MKNIKNLLLGIDIGSSGCKTCILDETGSFIGSASREYRPLSPRQGWFEQDPQDWYTAARSALGELRDRLGIDLDRVVAVGATGQMKGVTFIGRDGQPVRSSILWNDLRNLEEVRDLKSRCGKLLKKISYNPFNATSTVAKALWLERHEPENWKRVDRIVFPKDYITYRLTGRLQTDMSEASGICLFDSRSQSWWPDSIFEQVRFDRRKLPEFFPSCQVVGRLSPAAAEETGLPAGLPVVAGGSDATIESLSVGLKSASQCKIRLGTAGALVTVTEDLGQVQKGSYYVWSYLNPGQWMLDNNTRSCAQSTTWFRDVFFAHEPVSDKAYQTIAEEAKGVEIGSEGLFFHPYLQGEDSPYWDPRLKGSFFGLHSNHGRGHFARAVFEGTAFALRDARSSFGKLAERFQEYLLVGGGIKNRVWISIIADVLGIEAKLPRNSEASFGACMIAGIGAGVFQGIDDAVQRCVRFEGTISADPGNHRRYGELFQRYREMKQIFDRVYRQRLIPDQAFSSASIAAWICSALKGIRCFAQRW